MALIRSWVPGANDAESSFPLNNLPCGVFSCLGEAPRCGVAIGDMIVDMAKLERAGLLHISAEPLFDKPFWNALMAAGPSTWSRMRGRLIELLAEGSAEAREVAPHLVSMNVAQLHLPFRIAEYTDFYAARCHAENVGTMFRGAENALPPNWLHMPIGYNGRASSVVVSGTELRRPWGQVKHPNEITPQFSPSTRFDFELELGAVVGMPSQPGRPVTVEEADAMIFGYVLLNDWSARDIQAWEYQPLGPFQSKATATTISPWIVTRAALEPFRVETPTRQAALLPYLAEPRAMNYDIALEVGLTPQGGTETVICRTNASQLYYSAGQQLAHHTLSGCAMSTGDLLGSGTISGPDKASRGSMLELSWGGTERVMISGGSRSFLEDGDQITLRGRAQGDGYAIGFGDCSGRLLAALTDPYAREDGVYDACRTPRSI
ncbi:fumarylacetoacetase [Paracoccus sp. MBLB3053]|uniref:fumarylacetoacetase n=1 Tax=Paracoccus aurantius TaxID=3073814 RepID=A0ABU2HY75_9RHOB|nr:fumarylacetoacetase [Paracoccus sp. MBLB3053]MDS9469249.1 fumarylacetoacetase [Paracoccus sp. MBLB3053]